MDEERILSVAQYLKLINDTLALIPSEETVIEGEIVDYRVSQGKWINFDLKDEEEEAKISCFATTFQVKIPLESGMRVRAVGYPKVYERFGKFSLNVRDIAPVGEGALAKAYAALKKKLEAEGLFDAARKRSLPRFVDRIGLITSGEAAAYGDFLRILNNRWGGVEVLHIPVHVQGKNAVPDILQAFAQFNAMEEQPDVLVLTRGGGSLEDLHAFNDEQVARAVYSSTIPVVVGVGHERDESLCDFVADVRASTPSNAAERIVPNRTEVMYEVDQSVRRMHDQMMYDLERRARLVDRSITTLDRFIERRVREIQSIVDGFSHAFDRFRLGVVATRQHIERNETFIFQRFNGRFQEIRARVEGVIRVLQSFDVQKTLQRGFSIVRKDGVVIREKQQLASGDQIDVQLAAGIIDANVT